MITEKYKPLVVLGVAGLLFFGIIIAWKQTQQGRGAELARAMRTNFLSQAVARGFENLSSHQQKASTTSSSTRAIEVTE